MALCSMGLDQTRNQTSLVYSLGLRNFGSRHLAIATLTAIGAMYHFMRLLDNTGGG